MKIYFAALMVGVALPALGQSRVITNADLGKPFAWKVPPPSPAVLASLVANQFKWYPPVPHNFPMQVIGTTGEASLGPWKFPDPLPARRLDGSLYSDPPAVYGLPYYFGVPYFSRFDSHRFGSYSRKR